MRSIGRRAAPRASARRHVRAGTSSPRARSVRVRLFATAREAVGRAELARAVPVEGQSIGELLRRLAADFPPLDRVLPACHFARNGSYVRSLRARVGPGDEVAIHPPFSGG